MIQNQLCSLVYESFEVVGVLLHHGQHVVEDVRPHPLAKRTKMVPDRLEVRTLTWNSDLRVDLEVELSRIYFTWKRVSIFKKHILNQNSLILSLETCNYWNRFKAFEAINKEYTKNTRTKEKGKEFVFESRQMQVERNR